MRRFPVLVFGSLWALSCSSGPAVAPSGSGGGLPVGGAASGAPGASSGGTSHTGGVLSGGTSTGGATTGGGASVGGIPEAGGGSGAAIGAGGGSGGSEGRPVVVAKPGTTLLPISLEDKRQVFEGWGTSLCWWADRVGRWSPSGIERVADALLNEESGLGYTIFRYNIGGGENPAHDHLGQYKDIEGFQSSDGTFHWDADPYQRVVLEKLIEKSDSLILEAFSNSPPYWMTKSGCVAGNTDGSNNLKDDAYEPFAHYLTEVVRHFKETEGIVFRTLEPLNEPNAGWWKSGEGQEGCHFSPSNQEKIIQAVQAQLDAKGLTGTRVSAADENSIDDALKNLGSFSSKTVGALEQVNVHSYSGSQRKELRALATKLGKRLWQSESGPLSVQVADEIEAALFMGGRILSDLRDLGAEAWIDWQAGDVSRNWASLSLNDGQENFQPLKRFYVQAAFSRFIRPGAQFLAIEAPDIVAALNRDGRSLVVVMRNGGTTPREFTVDLTDLPTLGSEVLAYRTSRSEDLAPLPNLAIEDYSFVASATPGSLTTLVVPLD